VSLYDIPLIFGGTLFLGWRSNQQLVVAGLNVHYYFFLAYSLQSRLTLRFSGSMTLSAEPGY
jgi:hypothetical protein